MAAHRIGLKDGKMELAIQILAPEKSIESLRIDNFNRIPSLWRSDGKGGALPISVKHDGVMIGFGNQNMNFPIGDKETLLFLPESGRGGVVTVSEFCFVFCKLPLFYYY